MKSAGWSSWMTVGLLAVAAAAWLSYRDASLRESERASRVAELLAEQARRTLHATALSTTAPQDVEHGQLAAALRDEIFTGAGRLRGEPRLVACLLTSLGRPLLCAASGGGMLPPMTVAQLGAIGPSSIRAVRGYPLQIATTVDRAAVTSLWFGEFTRGALFILGGAVVGGIAVLVMRRGLPNQEGAALKARSASHQPGTKPQWAAAQEPPAAGGPASHPPSHSGEHRAALVLVVDDDPIISGFVSACLSDAYAILWASDGREGLQMALDHQPDLILVDEVMPVAAGTDLIRLLRSDSSFDDVPIVMMTASRDARLQPEVLRLGAQDFVAKPLHAEVLRARVDRLLLDRNKMAARLAGTADRLSALLEASQDPVVVVDERHFIVVGNSSAESLLRRPPGGLVGVPVRQLLAAESWGPYLRACRESAQRASWQRRPSEQIVAVLPSGAGLPLHCSVARCVDVTHRSFFSLVLRNTAEEKAHAAAAPSERSELSGALLAEMQARQEEIARELHDSVASSLAGVSLLIGGAQALADSSTVPLLSRAQLQIRDAAEQVRKISRGVLTDLGSAPLLVCLEQIAHDVCSSGVVDCQVRERGDAPEQSAAVRTNVYRIVQEAVSNAIRHGHARHIRITLLHARDGQSRIVVRDDGTGCDFAGVPREHPGVGLQSMRARAGAIGGVLRLQGRAQGGCAVRVTWRNDGRTAAEAPAHPQLPVTTEERQ